MHTLNATARLTDIPVFVVGGPTSFVVSKIYPVLKNRGMEVCGHWSMEHRSSPVIPTSAERVIVIGDMCSHSVADAAVAECKLHNIPFCRTVRKKASMVQDLTVAFGPQRLVNPPAHEPQRGTTSMILTPAQHAAVETANANKTPITFRNAVDTLGREAYSVNRAAEFYGIRPKDVLRIARGIQKNPKLSAEQVVFTEDSLLELEAVLKETGIINDPKKVEATPEVETAVETILPETQEQEIATMPTTPKTETQMSTPTITPTGLQLPMTQETLAAMIIANFVNNGMVWIEVQPDMSVKLIRKSTSK